MATALLASTNLDFKSSGATLAKLTAASSTITFEGASSGTCRLLGLSTPTSASDAANKAYVDSVANGISWKDAVRVATTANGTLATAFANGQTVDGVTLATGDRILIKNQSTGSENGLYVVQASGAPARAGDLASGSSAAGIAVFVTEGTTNFDKGWVCTSDSGSDVVGTDALSFSQFTGSTSPAGSSGQVQYNNSGSFGAVSTLSTNGTNLTLSGGNLTVSDNDELLIGTGSDCSIVHDGTNTSITNSTGNLTVENADANSDVILRVGSTTTSSTFIVQDSSSTSLLEINGAGRCTISSDVNVTGSFVNTTTRTTISTAANVTYSAAQLLNGMILRDPNGANRTDTTGTATEILAAFTGGAVGSSFQFFVSNTADAAETITVAAGTGVTLSGTMTVEQDETRSFLAVVTNTGTPAVTVYDLGSNFATSTSPGGSDTQLQYNSSGAFAGLSTVTTDGTNLALSGADLSLADNDSLIIGTGSDLTIAHDGTNTTVTSATGDLVVDNTNATGSTIVRLGADNSSVDFQVQNNSGTAALTVLGDTSATFAGAVDVTDTTQSTSSSTGSFIVSGGIGIAKDVFCDGSMSAVAYTSTSDATVKTNIAPIADPLQKLSQIEAYQYQFKPEFVADDQLHYGVLAQDLVAHGLGHMVKQDSNGRLSVDYNNLIGLLIGAVKDLRTQVDSLKSSII